MTPKEAKSFPFIVGCGRSGNTLLTVMLDSHPDLAFPGETGGFIIRLCRDSPPEPPTESIRKPMTRGRIEALVRQLADSHRYRAFGLDDGQVVSAAIASGASSVPDVFRAIFALYAGSHGSSRYGDKTPNHVLHIDRLAELFPEAVFIHVIRDGRDVALALMDVNFGPDNIDEAATYWKRRVEAGRSAGNRVGPDRYIEVRYEALVEDPGSVLRQVIGFIGLEYDPAMLEYGSSVRRQLEMSPSPEEDKSLTAPPTPGLRDWQSQMEAEDVGVFELLSGDLLRDLGYPTRTIQFDAGQSGRAALRASRELARFDALRMAGQLPDW